ncbi:beta-1,3-galactosyltransferase 5-like [Mytilus californianus]|uniref:beta-1,3-galactosyltransferase 5-like n=1 Tax=Mytilus californianus TaxID=6549 RepID=UPI00224670BF|nr:beta-1,3-galactosyltransferase 5-like [Mytilus californianus]
MNAIKCKRVITRFQCKKLVPRVTKLRNKILLIIMLTIFLLMFGNERNKIYKSQGRLSSKSEQLIEYRGKIISTEFERFYMNVSSDKLMDPLIHKHQYRTLLNTGKECKEKHKFILVLIYSSTYKFDERHIMRNTFGSISNFAKRDIVYDFVLGQTSDNILQAKIEKESVRYRDIIQGNFIDSYQNLTYKRVFSLFWVNKFCKDATFVIKIDDDITINIPLLIPYLNNKLNNNITNVLECFTILEARPHREPGSKWYTPLSDYPFPTFPPYCAGHSSIMSIDVVKRMYKTTSIVPYLWLEDVYGSGFIPWVLNIEIVRPNCYVKDVHQSFNEKPCHLFYINILQNDDDGSLFNVRRLKNENDSYKMWKTIKTSSKSKQNHTCMCW